MAFKNYNPNPYNNLVIDCTVRAISKATGQSWDETYIGLAVEGYVIKDMSNSNRVWGSYVKRLGFKKFSLPNTCPDCYTVKQFCVDYPRGTFILATGSHVVAVVNGDYSDTWDSGNEIPVYFWTKGD